MTITVQHQISNLRHLCIFKFSKNHLKVALPSSAPQGCLGSRQGNPSCPTEPITSTKTASTTKRSLGSRVRYSEQRISSGYSATSNREQQNQATHIIRANGDYNLAYFICPRAFFLTSALPYSTWRISNDTICTNLWELVLFKKWANLVQQTLKLFHFVELSTVLHHVDLLHLGNGYGERFNLWCKVIQVFRRIRT